LSRWSRLHLQSYVLTPVSRRVDIRQVIKQLPNLYHNMLHHVVPTPLSGIRVEKLLKNK
jgi:hypothetical protein